MSLLKPSDGNFTVELGDGAITWHGSAFEFPTNGQAFRAWKDCDDTFHEKDVSISCWRMTTPDKRHHFVIAITDEPGVRGHAARIMLRHGAMSPHLLDGDTVSQLVARRLRLIVETAGQGEGKLSQQAHYGEGALMNPDGTTTPFKHNPQG